MTSELARVLVARLTGAGQTVAVAESCTGGQVLSALTDVAGASKCVWGGVMVYTAAAKTLLADVPGETLEGHGVVSSEVTVAMARGIRRLARSDLGGAVTGWAGPSSAGPDPVGTVFLAVATAAGETALRELYTGSRSEVRLSATRDLLRLLESACPVEQAAP